DGSHVFVTGVSPSIGTYGDYVTLAYRAVDGQALWIGRYDGPAHNVDQPLGLAVHGPHVYVTGDSGRVPPISRVGRESTAGFLDLDYATVAYQDQLATPTPTPTPSGTPTPAPTPTGTPCSGQIIFSENFDELPAGTPAPCWYISNVDPDTPPNDAFCPD